MTGLPWLPKQRKIHLPSIWREENAEVQDPDLILSADLRKDYLLNPRLDQLVMPRSEPLFERSRIVRLGVNELENFEILDQLSSLPAIKVYCPPTPIPRLV